MTKIGSVLKNTDWKLLADQKTALVEILQQNELYETDEARSLKLDGLLNWIDALQGRGGRAGLPGRVPGRRRLLDRERPY